MNLGRKFILMCLILVLLLFSFRQITIAKNNTRPMDDPNFSNKMKKSFMVKQQNSKEVYLTFDDGPSVNNTKKIIEILNKNKVKATFFVIGTKCEENPRELKELANSGMCIMPHSYTHNYKIYDSLDLYIEDLNKCKETINKIIGNKKGVYIRIPGGSNNLAAKKEIMKLIKKTLIENGLYFVDWNVSSCDAINNNVSETSIEQNVLNQCANKKIAVVLMHDSYYKKTTVEALNNIIEALKNQGFEFKTFDDITEGDREKMIKTGIINRM